MKCIAYLKLSLKNLLASWKTSLIMMLFMPIGLSLIMGLVFSTSSEHSVSNINVNLYIEDEDNTKASMELIDFLNNNELKKALTITDNKEDALTIIIPKGYGEKLLSLENVEVLFKNKGDYVETKVVREILNNYHEGIYLSRQNLTSSQIQELQKSSVDVNSIKGNKRNYYEENSLFGISFAASIMIMSLIVAEYTPLAKNLNKKTSIAPMSKNTHYFLEYLSSVIYIFIILFLYVLFFNITGLSFKGVLLKSLIPIGVTALFVSSVYVFIVSFFKERYGKSIATVIMMLPLVFQLLLPQFLMKDTLKYFSPSFIVSEAFQKLIMGSVVNIELGIMLGIAIMLFFIARKKVNYDWRMGK